MDEVNLGFLKRRDPDAEQILGSSAHVTMYIMAVESQKWERRNVEGTLYVVKRRSHPRFQLVVLNKLSTENYVEAIESGFHAEVSPPYLIYTQGGGKVHGVWFYEEGDLNKIAALLSKVEASLPKPSQPPPQAITAQGGHANGQQDDGGFWDKPAAAAAAAAEAKAAAAAAPPPAAPPAGDSDAITNLFKNMQVKKQEAPAMSPPASVALPPSFFLPQQQQPQQPQQPAPPPPAPGAGAPPPGALLHHKQLDHLRAAAALSPASSTDMGSFSAGQQQAQGQQPDMLSKLFGKQAPPAPLPGSQPLILPQAPPPQPQQPAPPHPPPPGGGGNALAALFSNAASKSVGAAAGAGAGATPPRPVPGRAAAGPVEDRLRTALARLVQREEVLAALAEELRAVGLVQ